MVRMNHLNDKVNEIKDNFYGLIGHAYLEKYITKPIVDEDKLRFLYTMLAEKLPKKDTKLFTLSALLVDAALEIHEAVSLHNIQTDPIKKNRQLNVLAGDYYSSLYYYLLADSRHLPIIQVFSHSIQEINEYKMKLYDGKNIDFDEVKNNVDKVDTFLLQNLAEHFQLTTWKKAISVFFHLKRLVHEREAWVNGKATPLMKAIVTELFGSNRPVDELKKDDQLQVLEFWEEKVEEGKDHLLEHVKALLPKFERFFVDHLNDLFGPDYIHEKVAEEG
ncbi:heptaprenyl diphosphate synthase component 1 [Halalkalibacterium halodurans]|uniref:Heptaprenyl diphosphate synthase n=1 Tax=Halalkalibacterium halodurans TaxID=86665 RepID=A0A0M0KLS4_ALKHA|nr:heptaprenyl diphosphate synthase component 1 [Halalkalibacterium halodurans]